MESRTILLCLSLCLLTLRAAPIPLIHPASRTYSYKPNMLFSAKPIPTSLCNPQLWQMSNFPQDQVQKILPTEMDRLVILQEPLFLLCHIIGMPLLLQEPI